MGLVEYLPVDFANLLFGLNIDPDHLELLETEEQRIENRSADFLARVRKRSSGEPFLLHIELQNDNDPRMTLRYYTDIQLQWPREPVRQSAPLGAPASRRPPDDWRGAACRETPALPDPISSLAREWIRRFAFWSTL